MKTRTLVLLVAIVAGSTDAAAQPPLVVHEWGTFTSFQDSQGRTIAGINVDDEPVPQFVHRLKDLPIFTTRSLPARWSQGAPRCHSNVTMRLETPVAYFYPSADFDPQAIEVQATFVGGWLTEFFPKARSDAPGFPADLTASTRGSLTWTGLQLGGNEPWMPKTSERVWLAPRAVRASLISDATARETERYLFYRGVGHVDAPLIVREQSQSFDIGVRPGESGFAQLPALWLVQVMPDGRVQYTSARSTTLNTGIAAPADGSAASQLDQLRSELMNALEAEGLYPDEAQAMLDTWQLSYFQSEGRRLFFIVPRAWTEAHLPLEISPAADITRVMVGRIELVSPHQRRALAELVQLPDSAFPATPLYMQDPTSVSLTKHDNVSHSDLYRRMKRDVPQSLTLYESMGRFRDALLAHELQATHESDRRERLTKIMQTFSACDPATE